MGHRRLEAKRALVTGASSGIGAALARKLAAEGAHLVITARRKARLEKLADELANQYGVEVLVEPMDLAEPDASGELFARTEARGLAIDVLVNDAGFGMYDRFTDLPWERYQVMLQLNVTALTQLTWLYAGAMIRRGHGRILNVASLAAELPCPMIAVYAATKAYVRNFTMALDYELKATGVRACAICPGVVRTEFSAVANHRLRKSAALATMTAERCAEVAVEGMLRGRRWVVPGWLNAVTVLSLRLLPRAWVPALASATMAAAVERVPQ